MAIFYYRERTRRIIFTIDFLYNIYDHEKYYPYEPVNVNIKSLINIIQDNNRLITTKKRVRLNYHYFVVMENRQFPSMPYTLDPPPHIQT